MKRKQFREQQKYKSEKKCVMKLLNKDGQKEGECMKLKETQTSERKYWSAEGSKRLQHEHWKRKLKQCS